VDVRDQRIVMLVQKLLDLGFLFGSGIPLFGLFKFPTWSR